MKTVDADTIAAIESPERVVTASARVDWLNKGFYSAAPNPGADWDLYEDFAEGSLSDDWTLSGGASYDSNKFQVVLPTANPASSITYANQIDARDKTFYFELLAPNESPLSSTNQVRITLRQDDTHQYFFRNDSGGFYVEIHTPNGQHSWSNIPGVTPGDRIKAIGFSFNRGLVYTSIVATTGTVYELDPQQDSQPLNIGSGTLAVESYTTDSTTDKAILSKVVIGPNLDDITPHMSSLSVDRNLSGAFPDEVSYAEGSAAAQTDIDLVSGESDDERRHAAWQFSPFNSDSPFSAQKSQRIHLPFSASIKIEKADGTTTEFPRMVGTTRDLDVSVKNRTASLSALDYRDKLAGSVTLPLIDGEMQGCDATSLLSYALLSGGIPVAPGLQDNCKLYLPMHGTIAPVVSGNPAAMFTRVIEDASADIYDFTEVIKPAFIDNPHSVSAVDAHWHAGDHRAVVGRLTPSTDGLDIFSRSNASGGCTAWFKGDSQFVGGGSPSSGHNPNGMFVLAFVVSVVPAILIEIGIMANGEQYISFTNGSSDQIYRMTNAPLPLDDQWHQLAWKFNLNAAPGEQMVAMSRGLTDAGEWITWDNEGGFPANITGSLPAHDQWVVSPSGIALSIPMSDLQVFSFPGTQSLVDSKVNAFGSYDAIPYLNFELGGNVDTEPKEIWGLVTDIAAATRSSVYFDEEGTFRFVSLTERATTEGQTVQKTVTSVDHITELDISQTVDSVKNTISVDYTPFQSVRGGVVFSTTDTFVLPGLSTTILRLTFDDPISFINTRDSFGRLTPFVWDADYEWPPDPNIGYMGIACARASLTNTSDLKNIISLPWPNLVGSGGDYIDVEVVNPTKKAVYIFNDGQAITSGDWTDNKTKMEAFGSPSILITGNKLTRQATSNITVVDQFSTNQYGAQAFSFSNPYIQDRVAANSIAGSLLSDLKDPVATADITIIGDPRLELGDRIRIQDTEGNVFDGEFWIQGIEDTLDGSGYTQKLTVRQAHSTLYWAADTNHEPPQDRWDQFSWAAE